MTDEAIRFVTESRDQPFALLLHFREPHLPYGPVPEADVAALRDVDPGIPGVPGGREVGEAVTQLDTLPTVLGMLGVPMPGGLVQRGSDVSPLLRGEAAGAVRADLQARLVEWRRGLGIE
jgi:hypothetical protein